MIRQAEPGGEWLLFVAAALFAWLGSVPAADVPVVRVQPRDPEHLRLVTWNVGRPTPDGGAALADELVLAVAARLQSLDADVIVLQEIRNTRQLRQVWGELGIDDWEGRVGQSAAGRLAVLARGGELEVRPVDRSDGRRPPLLCTYRRLGEPPVGLVGVHADPWSAQARNREIGAAAQLLHELGATVGGKVLLGDLNLDLDLDKRRDLFSDDEYLDLETYNFVSQLWRDAGRGTGATAEPDRRLDYCFVDSNAFEVVQAGPVRGSRVGGMDHEPLLIDLRWIPGGATIELR